MTFWLEAKPANDTVAFTQRQDPVSAVNVAFIMNLSCCQNKTWSRVMMRPLKDPTLYCVASAWSKWTWAS